jgi:hypothetical protein
MDIKTVTLENFNETMTKYIDEKSIKITDIDSMIGTYMSMIENRYLFTFDRDLLKDMLVDLTYMYSPNDDANKDRVLFSLVGSDSDDDDDEDDDEEEMMKKFGNLTEHLMKQQESQTTTTVDEVPDDIPDDVPDTENVD